MLSYTILAACKARGSSLRVHFKRCPMMKSGLQTAEAMLMATITKKKKRDAFYIKEFKEIALCRKEN
ncbi:hypothetical protein ERO13_D04G010550v2 [Gossypium hirsutum]|uniref:Uncharacterized protein n=1 Tax=Gossypium mustelinum TaxID=34275 RepID=A0A5D2V8N6_GOSMU|nr:hypothetical protein ERO13_D04G010550v2 [Gossypium hirsutum]TYI85685.1 hypothetical protein E1A91_D04G012700v1 [Gossypium mustelinum]